MSPKSLAIAVSFITLSLFAREWYVDAVNGNDEWDGSTSNLTAIASNVGPRRTLAGAMAISALGANDTVWVLPGDYSTGHDWYNGTNRCYITKAGLRLRSTHGPQVTFITGDLSEQYDPATSNFNLPIGPKSHDSTVYTNLSSHSRCIGIDKDATDVVIDGFTLRNGMVPYKKDGTSYGYEATYGGGVLDMSKSAWVIDCVVTNCYAARGGAIWGASAAQCRFLRCRSGGRGSNCESKFYVNCLFRNAQGQPPITNEQKDDLYTTLINCTFVDASVKGYFNYKVKGIYNSILVGNTSSTGNGGAVSSVLYGGVENCVLGSGTFTNLTGSAINEETCVTDATLADVGFVNLVSGDYRPSPSGIAHGVGDASHLSLVPLPEGYVHRDIEGRLLPTEGRIDAGCCQYVQRVGYVDCVNGSDGSDGLSLQTAKKTIRESLRNLGDGDVLWVAPGTYGSDEGGTKVSASDKVLSRVMLPVGVTVESLEGPEKTVILGELVDTETREGSVRCAYLNARAVLRGFTLTGGNVCTNKTDASTGKTESVINKSGAAVYGSPEMTARVVDCIVTNNYGFDSLNYRVNLEGCRITHNKVHDTGSAGTSCSFKNCLIDYNEGNHSCFNQIVPMENCTIGANNKMLDGTVSQIFSYNDIKYAPKLVNCFVLAGRTWRSSGLDNLFTATNSVIHSGICSDTTFSAERCRNCIRDKNTTTLRGWIDADYTPINANLIDAGTNEQVTIALDGKDLAGLPRCMNGRIDIGAFEKNWLGDFAAALGDRVVVTNASPAVTLEDGALVVPAGGIEGTFPRRGNAELKFSVSGTGTLKAYVDGTLVGTYAGAEAVVNLGRVAAGSTFKIVYEPEGGEASQARLVSLKASRGLMMSLN